MIEWNKTEGYKNWSLAQFVEWYKGLEKHFGNEKAPNGYLKRDVVWITFWVASEGGLYPKLKAVIAVPSQFKKEIDYIKKASPELYRVVGFQNAMEFKKFNPIDKSAQIIEAGANVVDAVVGAVGGFSKALKFVVPAIVLGGLIFGGVYLYNKAKA